MEENNQNLNQTPEPSEPLQGPSLQEPNPASPVNENPQTPPQNRSFKLSVKAIVSIIVFLLLAGGAAASFTIFRPQILKLTSKPTISPIPLAAKPSSTPTPTPDPTANWKTFTEDGFSFKYPKTFSYSNDPRDPKTSYFTTKPLDNSIEPLVYFIFLQKTQALPNSNGNDIKIDFKTKIINGIQTYTTTDIPSRNGEISVYFKSKSGYVSLSFAPYDPNKPFSDQKLYHDIFNQILSTFKFTNFVPAAPTSGSTANWKTFTSLTGKFSIKYPLDWTEIHLGELNDSSGYEEFASFGPGIKSVTEDPNGKLAITVTNVNKSTSPINTAQEYINSQMESLKNAPDLISNTSENVNVNDSKGYKLITSYKTGKVNETYTFEKNGLLYIFVGTKSNSLDQILSTFKFTN